MARIARHSVVRDGFEALGRVSGALWGTRRAVPVGAAPGTIHIDPQAKEPELDLIAYTSEVFEERRGIDLADVRGLATDERVTWLNVEGLGDERTLRGVGEEFGMHELALEDVAGLHQRAKVERYGDERFIVARMFMLEEGVRSEQVSMFVGAGFLITFQEGHKGDAFEPVRKRLREGHAQLRRSGTDFLACALLDAVVDAYFPILEALGERLEDMENLLVIRPDPSHMGQIHRVKRELLGLRRAVWPLREALRSLMREESDIIADETRPYLTDVYDHVAQVIDLVETYREIASGLVDLYTSSISNRMNEVMKVLTVIATIFIPLSFIVGLYGMNFDRGSPWNMPELGWRYGYVFVLALCFGVAVMLLAWFYRRGWLRDDIRLRQLPTDEESCSDRS